VTTANMNRTRVANLCPACNEVPQFRDGTYKCACGKSWQRIPSLRGSEGEEKWLADNCFEFTQDVVGNIYYVGPLGHIIYLYPDGAWDSDKAPPSCTSLEEYIALLSASDCGLALATRLSLHTLRTSLESGPDRADTSQPAPNPPASGWRRA
jgi:hypothetical protein